jgi:hypothetical protein
MQTRGRQLALRAYCPNKYTVEVKQSKRSTVGYSILFYLYVQQNLLLLRPTEQKESCAAQLLLLLLLLYAC